jgi:hypothetical protein
VHVGSRDKPPNGVGEASETEHKALLGFILGDFRLNIRAFDALNNPDLGLEGAQGGRVHPRDDLDIARFRSDGHAHNNLVRGMAFHLLGDDARVEHDHSGLGSAQVDTAQANLAPYAHDFGFHRANRGREGGNSSNGIQIKCRVANNRWVLSQGVVCTR